MGRYDYSILLDIRERLAVIVGAGPAATRKARGLLSAGAPVRVVAAAFHEDMPEGIERITDSYHAGHLQGAFLVFAATDDPAVNTAVVSDARKIGALVSRLDAQDHGDFILPAVWRNDQLSVSVSTGHAPMLARLIRDKIAEWIDPRWAAMSAAMEAVRPIIVNAPLSKDRRREIFQALTSDDALETAGEEGANGVLCWLAGRYSDLGLPPADVREKEEL